VFCDQRQQRLISVININKRTSNRYAFTLEATRSSSKSSNKDRSSKKQKNAAASTKSARGSNNNNNNNNNKPPSPPSGPKRRGRSTPPWQVLSSKDVKKNIDKERERRQLIQDGAIQSHEKLLDDVALQNKESVTLSKSFLTPAQQQFCKWKRFSPQTTRTRLRFIGAHVDASRKFPVLGVPEVAFCGRSNVGKSSIVNQLSYLSSSSSSSSQSTGSKDTARVGKTPGATASVNFYALVDERTNRDLIAWVDLPGFGYAKLSQETKETIQQVAEDYLTRRKELALAVLLVDVRRMPSPDDRAVLAALYDLGLPLVVVATKKDKMKNAAELERQLTLIRDGLGLPENQPLCVSSTTGEGCKDLYKIILETCEGAVADFKSQYEGGGGGDASSDSEAISERYQADEEWDSMDEPVYSQGYDWVHDSGGVMYEGGDDDFYDDMEESEDYVGTDDDQDDGDSNDVPVPQRETLKSLRKKVRQMERRGEL
jgi:GTP-binding protein